MSSPLELFSISFAALFFGVFLVDCFLSSSATLIALFFGVLLGDLFGVCFLGLGCFFGLISFSRSLISLSSGV
jgi:hypothetical protein